MSRHRAIARGGIYAPPYQDHGAEYGPISARSHRMVALETAEQDYQDTHGAVGSPGLWDWGEAQATLPSPQARAAPERYDAAAMAAWVERPGTRLTTREWEVYMLFWRGLLSYGEVARRLTTNLVTVSKDRVRECVQRLRARLARP